MTNDAIPIKKTDQRLHNLIDSDFFFFLVAAKIELW
jgi:hypothetical protein